ncbi:MAG TPA: hypothetical protein VG898_05440 [Solirubrobacterales bacterium]|nr:hypothetical protein [Solirubrobacterales bacterium]
MGRTVRNLLVAWSASLALAAAPGPAGAAPSAPTTDATARAGGACGSAVARAAVSSFVTSFNRGDHERLDALFAPSPAFQWYSQNAPGARLGRRAKDRDTLIAYFRARHSAGDRLGLVSFQPNAGDNGRRNFGLVLRRSVKGFRHGDWFRLDAKGTVECSAGKADLIVLSLGAPRGEDR